MNYLLGEGGSALQIDTVIGIDPGAAGGIAIYRKDCPEKTVKMPREVGDLRDLIRYYKENFHPIVFIEKLSVRPDDIIKEGSEANLGKLYRVQRMLANFEQLKAVISSEGVPFVLVHPASWQAKLGLRHSGEEKAERKRRLRDRAQELYPAQRVTLWNADALLIMHFGRWALINDWKWVKANLPERELDKLF